METNEKIEKWSKIIYNFIVVVSPITLIAPKLIFSLYIYFTGGNKSSVMVLIFTYASNSFGLTFMACEMGHWEIESFVQIKDEIDQFKWYLFPMKAKRLMPMIIKNAQRPIEIGCFGSHTCKRKSFKKGKRHFVISNS